jgi:alpha-L-fucosidase 2
MAIHPLGLIDWDNGAEDQKVIEASLADLERLGTKQWTGYSFSWLANFWARAKNGQKAEEALGIFSKAFCLRNSFHCNGDQSGQGYSSFTYRPFTLEGNFAAAAAIQEMLLQSHTGTIRVFPAVPDDWKDVSFKTLRTQGAFLVSAERTNGQTVRVEVTSEKGGVCRLANPFGTKSYDYKCPASASVVTEGDTIIIKTRPGQKLILTGGE